jgi:protein-S-isoprenylcysteine O-methyltransferase Ste14
LDRLSHFIRHAGSELDGTKADGGGAEMSRVALLVYGVVCYLVFLGTFLYAIGFVGDLMVPWSIDGSEERGSTTQAVLIDLVLLGLFAVPHSVMARQGFKRWWTRIVPNPAERSTYVLLSSLLLALLFWQWRPLPQVIYEVTHPAGRLALRGLFWLGWAIVLWSTFLTGHFDLLGLRQVYLAARGQPYTPPEFKMRALYRWVRHPLLLGFLIAFWATPRMTIGHLLFAAATTAYILVAVRLEERDLVAFYGEQYRQYQRRVGMFLPTGVFRSRPGTNG